MNVCLPVFARIKVWSSSCSLYRRQTGPSLEGKKKQKKVEKNDFSVFSVADLLCLEVNCLSGERRSVSRACSGTAWLPPGSPPNGGITRNRAVFSICWTPLVDLLWGFLFFDGLTTRETVGLCCIWTARNPPFFYETHSLKADPLLIFLSQSTLITKTRCT